MTNQSVINGINTGPYLAFNPASAGDVTNNYEQALANGEKLKLFQFMGTFDVMPNDHVTFRIEYGYRNSSIPYFAGRGGTTSPTGWTNLPGELPWTADLQKEEHRVTFAVNFRL